MPSPSDKGWGEPARRRYARVVQCENLFHHLVPESGFTKFGQCPTWVPVGVPYGMCRECRQPDPHPILREASN